MNLAQKPLIRLMSLWVKPTVLPVEPASLIDPQAPVIYVLESGGVADATALSVIAERTGLPAPLEPIQYGDQSEPIRLSVLQRRPYLFARRRKAMAPRLTRALHTATRDYPGELQIVPVAVYWGRAPDREDSLWRFLFTENWEIGGRTHKFFTTIVHGRRTLVNISQPLSINALLKTETRPELLERKLFRILRVHFRERRIASLGPDLSHRRMLIGAVVADKAVQKVIAEESRTKSELAEQGNSQELSPESKTDTPNPKLLQKHLYRAEKYAHEIAADVSYPTTRILHRLLTWLWNQLYDGIKLSGVDRLKSVADGRELVYVPCHRSHIDYLLLSYILYEEGYSLPHIAAGINLNLPVVGGILRRGGAFFLRRTFAGNKLYAAVFNAYLKEILQRGHTLEYFVEGGRSRTGRLLPPKAGMLAMTVHAYLRNPRTPVVFVPVYFGYERLLEGKAFTSELAGNKKRKESILGLLGTLKSLRQQYGTVHVNFGEPILLNDLLDTEYPNWREQAVQLDRPEWLPPIVDQLGASIMQTINLSASVTPISILATAALATAQGAVSQQELERQIRMNHQLLATLYRTSNVVIPPLDPIDTIEHAKRLGFIIQRKDDIGPLIFIKRGQSAPLTYFRNNIAHLLILPSLIASAFSNSTARSTKSIQELVQLAYPYLQEEFFIKDEASDARIVSTLNTMKDMSLLESTEGGWRRAPAGTPEAISLLHLAASVTPSLERYYLTIAILEFAPEQSISRKELHARVESCAKRLALTHGKIEGDLYDKHLLKTFLGTLEQRHHLREKEGFLSVHADLEALESKARTLLQQQSRHAILNAAMQSISQISVDS